MRRIIFYIKFTTLALASRVLIIYRAIKASIGQVVFTIKSRVLRYRVISAKEFLTEFPPNKKCPRCDTEKKGGYGWLVIQDPITKKMAIRFCKCVLKQYRASKKRYIVKDIE